VEKFDEDQGLEACERPHRAEQGALFKSFHVQDQDVKAVELPRLAKLIQSREWDAGDLAARHD